LGSLDPALSNVFGDPALKVLPKHPEEVAPRDIEPPCQIRHGKFLMQFGFDDSDRFFDGERVPGTFNRVSGQAPKDFPNAGLGAGWGRSHPSDCLRRKFEN
jgi:hypothetical protein